MLLYVISHFRKECGFRTGENKIYLRGSKEQEDEEIT
jgi:hypothetical protein